MLNLPVASHEPILKRQEWVVLSSSAGEYECHLGHKSLNKIWFFPCSHQQGEADGAYEVQGQPGLQQSSNGGVQDPQASEEGTQQAHYPGPQESRLGPLQEPAW